MTMSNYLPPDVFMNSVEGMIDLSTASTLALLCRGWRCSVEPRLPAICMREYGRRLPGFRSSFSAPPASEAAPAPPLWGLNHQRILAGLDAMERVHRRLPRQPYRALLACFTDGSMVAAAARRRVPRVPRVPRDPGVKSATKPSLRGTREREQPSRLFEDHIKHLIDIFAYASGRFGPAHMAPGAALNLRVWMMFAILEFCRVSMRWPGAVTADRSMLAVMREKAALLEHEVRVVTRCRRRDAGLVAGAARLRLQFDRALLGAAEGRPRSAARRGWQCPVKFSTQEYSEHRVL